MNLLESILAVLAIGSTCAVAIALIVKGLKTKPITTDLKLEQGKLLVGGRVKLTPRQIAQGKEGIGASITFGQTRKTHIGRSSSIDDPWVDSSISQPSDNAASSDAVSYGGVMSDYGSGEDFGTFG